MTFDYNSPAGVFIPKRKGIDSSGRIGRLSSVYRLPLEVSALLVEEVLPSEHSALGCRSEMTVSIAMRFVGYTRVAIIRFGAT